MSMHESPRASAFASCPLFCEDDELDYFDARTRFVDGAPFLLDESYRLTHLPLVAPQHPKVIVRATDRHCEMGQHDPVVSLVLPVPGAALRASPEYLALEAETRATPFASKVAWNMVPRRQDRLHATICRPREADGPLLRVAREQAAALRRLGPLSVELRGLFSGNVNHGRLYLRAYPEKRAGLNTIHALQRAMGCPATDLYVVGLYNLVDDLDPAEAHALAALIERWWDRTILTFRADTLWLLAAHDNLVLDSEILEVVRLG